MTRRPTPKSLESLHATLQKLEQMEDPDSGEHSMSELKRVVLNRIADLELSKTLETENGESHKNAELVDLDLSRPFTEDTILEEEIEKIPLDKLD